MHWDIERRSCGGIEAKEFRWRHTDDGEWDVIEDDGLPDRVGRTSKPFLARFKTHNSDSGRAGAIIVEANQPSRGRSDPGALEVFPGHQLTLNYRRAAPHDQVQRPGSLISEQARENGIV